MGRLLKRPLAEWGGHQSFAEGAAFPLPLNMSEVEARLGNTGGCFICRILDRKYYLPNVKYSKNVVYWWKELHSLNIECITTPIVI